jgi:iron complex outermembrane recepter protein
MRTALVKLKLPELLIPLASCAIGLFPAQAFAGDTAAASTSAAPQGTSQSADQSQPDGQSTENASSQLQEVVVTGYAASLEKAIQYKFKAPNITDSISAEGIGQFPEQNLAESLQRITGVQITRNQGEGQFISVRGLDPKFTDTLFNGRELPSGSGTRAFDFQVLSGDFAQRVDVYKSPTADLPEGGLAATVNVQSIHPLEYGQRKAVLTAEGIYDEQGRKGLTPHLTGLYTDTFFDHRLGWMVGVDLNERNVDDQNSGTDGVLPDSSYTGPGKQYRIFGMRGNDNQGFDRRLSLLSMLEYRVSDSLELRLDTLDSEFSQSYNDFEMNNFYPGAFASGPETTLSETVSPSGVQTAWEGTNVYAWLEAVRDIYQQKVTSNALDATWTLASWTVDGQASFGEAREEATNQYVQWNTKTPGATFHYNAAQDPGGPIGYGFVNYNPLDTSNYNWYGEQGPYQEPTTDKIWNFKVDAQRSLDSGWLNSMSFGANYQNRTLGRTPNWVANTATGFAADMTPYLMMLNNSTWFSSYSGPAQFPTNALTVNVNKFFSDYPLSGFIASHPPAPQLTQITQVQEKSEAAYAQVNFGTPDKRLTGNLGVRAVHTEELSSGYGPGPGATLVYGATGASNLVFSSQGFVSQTNSYNNVLPNLNLTYRLNDDLLARFAAAQVMQRPDMNLLAQASVPSAATQPPPPGQLWNGTLSKGNPNLKPYLSNQLDLSLEWYFGPRSILAADFFLKDVKNLVLTNYFPETEDVLLAGNVLGSGNPVGSVKPINLSVGQPGNASKTTLKGLEVAWEQPFDFLPGFLRSFGAEANYTHIWSGDVVLSSNQPPVPVTGVSDNTYNAGLYYDDGRVGIHANYNYRSEWVADPTSYFGDGVYVKGYGQLDIAANFNVTHWLAITASVINATQSPLIQVDRYDINRLYDLSGRRFYVGLHATL